MKAPIPIHVKWGPLCKPEYQYLFLLDISWGGCGGQHSAEKNWLARYLYFFALCLYFYFYFISVFLCTVFVFLFLLGFIFVFVFSFVFLGEGCGGQHSVEKNWLARYLYFFALCLYLCLYLDLYLYLYFLGNGDVVVSTQWRKIGQLDICQKMFFWRCSQQQTYNQHF